jgi:hypothetical protein
MGRMDGNVYNQSGSDFLLCLRIKMIRVITLGDRLDFLDVNVITIQIILKEEHRKIILASNLEQTSFDIANGWNPLNLG